ITIGVTPQLRAPLQKRGRVATACFLSGISGWFSLSLNPLARGCRRIWRGEIWKYGFGGAVADFVLVISGSRRRPRRALWIGSGDARERQAPVVEQRTQGGLADAETLAGLCNRDG